MAMRNSTYPFGISRHDGGNLYVADFGNNAIRRISPMGPDWVTSTVAGFSGATGTNDGPASQAMFNSPNGIAVDASETLYVTDQFNYTIRKIEPVGSSWVVSTVGGLALARGTNDGVGASARFYRPWGIAVDQAGNLFVADSGNYTIRRGTLPSAPSPALQILLSANQVVLSWPITASNYVLETTPALGSGASWAALTNGVAVSDSNYCRHQRGWRRLGFLPVAHSVRPASAMAEKCSGSVLAPILELADREQKGTNLRSPRLPVHGWRISRFYERRLLSRARRCGG